MKLYLARHGQTDDNLPPTRFQGQRDSPLNAVGQEQAVGLAEAARRLRVEALYSSSLSRAKDTATTVADRLQLELTVDERLSEGWRGLWEGKLFEEVKRLEPEEFAAWMRPDPDFRFPGGESLGEHRERSLAAMADIAGRKRPTLVVCHGGTIRLVLLEARGQDLYEFHKLKVPNAEPIAMSDDELERVLEWRRMKV